MEQKNKNLNVLLWIAQVALAAIFLMAGIMKSTTPINELSQKLNWVSEDTKFLVRFIGISELLGAIGLILPSLLRIKPILTPLAALGFLIIMISAIIFHIVRGEYNVLPINFLFGAIALFIAWGRYKKVPIQPKS
ncbi:MAG TPA: DoxX family protein [Bacteroidia bacterium]|nr:MAG: hypothetical protein KatS3mg027_0989 [Bacteroidia bacterium]GIV28803.1 MAG: hypothetical protein KatS3mg027_2617 [Bacteroidia bacterium]HPQ07734.1 DoxX family protein [Bacteroidia bacterium]